MPTKTCLKELKKDKNVESVYLFGSHAKGKARKDSDIDIAVIARKDLAQSENENILSNSSEKLDLSLFWDMPVSIRFRIIEGKLLFTKNKLNLIRAKSSTIKEYMDFKPVLDLYCRRILGVSNV